MTKNVCIGILTLFHFGTCFGQKSNERISIKGHILDIDNNPIELVQVVISNKERTILSFSYSDSDGRYEVSFPENEAYFISFQRLGFEKKNFELENFTPSTIILNYSEFVKLNEVIITDKTFIDDQGDTIDYKVNKISNGTERKLEDILKKLPGVTIDQNGKITYQGREISRILLDGDDLTGTNYKILSKGMSAEWIDEVQIIKKFSTNKILRGIKSSEDIAINLKIFEDIKSPLFGKAGLGLGTWNRFEIQKELLQYRKKIKSFLVTEATNTGEDIEVMDLELFEKRHSTNQNIRLISNLLNNPESAPEFFSEKNFNFQNGIYGNPNILLKLNDSNTLKSNTTLTWRQNRFFQNDSSFIFLDKNDGFEIIERLDQEVTKREFFQELTWTREISKKKNFEVSTRFSNQNRQLNNQFENNFRNQYEKNLLLKSSFFLSGNYSLLISKIQAIELELHYLQEKLSESLGFDEVKEETNNYLQDIVQNNQSIGMRFNHYKKWNESFLSETKLSFQTSTQTLNQTIFDSEFNREFSLHEINLFSSINKTWSTVNIVAKSNLRKGRSFWEDKHSNFLFIEPTILIKQEKKMLKQWHFSQRYALSISNSFLTINEINGVDFFQSFRHQVINLSNPQLPERNRIAFALVELKKTSLNYFINSTELLYRNAKNSVASTFNFNNDNLIDLRQNNAITTNLGLKTNTSKYISQISTLVGFNYEITNASTPLAINEINSTSYNLIQKKQLTVGFVGIEKFSISLGFEINNLNNRWNQNEKKFDFQSINSTITYSPSLKLNVNLFYEGIQLNEQLLQANSIVGSSINFKPKSNNWELSVKYNNIFNNRDISIIQIEPGINRNTTFGILRSFAILNANYRF